MNHQFAQILGTVALVSVASSFVGCQQVRRMHITSNPSGALVHVNDVEVGRTPLEVDFTYFGVYDVRLQRPGYEPLMTEAEAKPRLHDHPGLDLAALLVPGGTETIIEWHFDLEPAQNDPTSLVDRAVEAADMLGTE